ncbi:phosphoribosylformylglycinamidine synthase subunit PurS [Rhodohalobacter sp. SW132]|uniref:phosphoribosylformylglycinamidine synthase subunit PurS n=1 Tax=Rhodohalobacter sp. SW132 TaxID=2293433 RepID=UPI000E22A479|nr:phosphoribosylformylglycinamidine synthase subunit PurS [Rhodohalobacter sp. SW132]REL38417.1 phosphoribosylformylglycinamidine synthase subunit PurS [Rhodohalobacter sp. SW132]
MYKANVNITLRKSILDPKGKAAHHALHNLGLNSVEGVRIGKFIELDIDAESEKEALVIAENACTQLLANEVMEDYEIEITKPVTE